MTQFIISCELTVPAYDPLILLVVDHEDKGAAKDTFVTMDALLLVKSGTVFPRAHLCRHVQRTPPIVRAKTVGVFGGGLMILCGPYIAKRCIIAS
jgi:hypothetical protein